MELIIIIAIISYVIKAAKKANESETKYKQNRQETYQMPKQASCVNSAKVQEQVRQLQGQMDQFQKAAQENIARAKQRAQQKQENKEAMQQVHASRMEADNTTILQRAKANADEDKVDVTLETMEAEHNHSERVAPAEHHHPQDIIPENILGKVEDLMIKGYDGNLCFERDFVGEGLDMISRFSYQ